MTIMLILMAVGQLLSLSRAGISSCLLSFGILMYLFSRGIGRIKITTILILLLILIASLTYWIGYDPIIHKFKLIPQEWQSTLGRWTIWKDSIKIIKDFPFFGVGLSNYGAIFPRYKSFIETRYVYAHNDYLQFGIEMGLPGFILLVIVLYSFYKRVLNYPWQHHSRTRALALGMIAASFAVLIHSFFDFPLQVPANAILLVTYYGLLYACMKLDSQERLERMKAKKEIGFEK